MGQARGHKIEADGGERLRFSDADFVIRASADTTDGAFSMLEEADPLDTPLHVHKNEDELWYVLEGEHVVQIGDDEFHVGPGETVFGPRGVPHAQRRVVPRTGRFLEFFYPAGFEGFFRELAEAERSGSSMPEEYVRVSEKYGITWL
jgi:mannose-6-phosphate isomerase-like protein (cupin superfamily)